MKRPEHPFVVALVEAYARRAGLGIDDLWAYVDRRQAPPPDVRAAIVEAFFPRIRPDDFLLPSSGENDTLDTMDATTISAPRRGRPMANKDHPFVAALLRERLTIADVAKDLKCGASTVKAWYKDEGDDAYRPIPRASALELKRRFKVPLSVWPRIAD
jgi:hypothetical protein